MQVKSGITGLQIRAARGALNWSVKRLSEETGIGTATIVRYENEEKTPPSRMGNLNRLLEAFEAAGIEFNGSPDDAPGIRIHSNPEQPSNE